MAMPQTTKRPENQLLFAKQELGWRHIKHVHMQQLLGHATEYRRLT
ncbi:MAG: hypothetical protein ACI861_000859 [Paracoccaceae bacterium]|jgi:hypothetical protein